MEKLEICFERNCRNCKWFKESPVFCGDICKKCLESTPNVVINQEPEEYDTGIRVIRRGKVGYR